MPRRPRRLDRFDYASLADLSVPHRRSGSSQYFDRHITAAEAKANRAYRRGYLRARAAHRRAARSVDHASSSSQLLSIPDMRRAYVQSSVPPVDDLSSPRASPHGSVFSSPSLDYVTLLTTCPPSSLARHNEIEALKASFVGRSYYSGPTNECRHCGALFWDQEKLARQASSSDSAPAYASCCREGRIYISPHRPFPPPLDRLMSFDVPQTVNSFMPLCRQYNSMLAFTSIGVNVDRSINVGSAPCVFRINGVVHHVIGSLLPPTGSRPEFAQLYIYDTAHEIDNRMGIFQTDRDDVIPSLDPVLLRELLAMLDIHNPIVQKFRLARDRLLSQETPEIAIRLIGSVRQRRGIYSLPAVSELAALLVGDMSPRNSQYDIIVQAHDGAFQHVSPLHPSLMVLQYPLLFPYGYIGYHPGMKLRNIDGRRSASRQDISMLEYYRYEAHYRRGHPNQSTCCGRLSEQMSVDAYSCVEANRLSYFYFNQHNLRTETYQGISDAVARGDASGRDIGVKVILPASFTGGKRYMTQNCQDALAICRVYGCPQLFTTFTCSPKWPEIVTAISYERGQRPSDKPDIVTRVFHMKQKEFLSDVRNGRTFGKIRAVMHSIEFQKRGLPHSHNIIWLVMDKEVSAELVDSFISAEIPDVVTDPLAYALVDEFMVHGPCGQLNPSSSCMVRGRCSKGYPKHFRDQTAFDSQGYPLYRRRQDDRFMTRGNIRLDNKWIVPYSPHLLKKFQAHINVEWCIGTHLIKYLFKYVTKGPDHAAIAMQAAVQTVSPATRFHCSSLAAQALRSINQIPSPSLASASAGPSEAMPFAARTSVEASSSRATSSEYTPNSIEPVDEIAQYINARYLSACEAYWRTWGYDIHARFPAVERLIVHLPGMNTITYSESRRLSNILQDPASTKTMLTEWFTVNQQYPCARHLTYCEFPSEWTWYATEKRWCMRKRGPKVGRLRHVHPSAGELFYLRMLLMVVKGAISYTDIRTYNGTVHNTFRAACKARGLISDDDEWALVFDEAIAWASSQQLRSLFMAILLHCDVADPRALYDKYWAYMVDDIAYNIRLVRTDVNQSIPSQVLQNRLLQDLDLMFTSHNMTLQAYGLPQPPPMSCPIESNRLLLEELSYDKEQLALQSNSMYSMLNDEQLHIFHTVLSSIAEKKPCLYFVSGHGGTGKTFLWKSIIAKLRSEGHIVLAVASSGVAALLLPGGRIAHSRFRIPIEVDASSSCSIGRCSQLGDLIVKATLILWDEAPMAHRHCMEALDQGLRDLLGRQDPANADKPFGGKPILFGGDFRQVLPVVEHGGRSDVIEASLIKSPLWSQVKVMRLTVNMRLMDPSLSEQQRSEMLEFAQWILDIGEGRATAGHVFPFSDNNNVVIPNDLLIKPTGDTDAAICYAIYDDFESSFSNPVYLAQRAIVCPTNAIVDDINHIMLSAVPASVKDYLSYDTISSAQDHPADVQLLYPPEFLNTISINNFPAHVLRLKTGAPVMLCEISIKHSDFAMAHA